MNEINFSLEKVFTAKSAFMPLAPLPVYPKPTCKEAQNHSNNNSKEPTSIDDSKNSTLNMPQLPVDEQSEKTKLENIEELSETRCNKSSTRPISSKKSSFSICKNFFFNKNFEEKKFDELDFFSSLNIKANKEANLCTNRGKAIIIPNFSTLNGLKLQNDKFKGDSNILLQNADNNLIPNVDKFSNNNKINKNISNDNRAETSSICYSNMNNLETQKINNENEGLVGSHCLPKLPFADSHIYKHLNNFNNLIFNQQNLNLNNYNIQATPADIKQLQDVNSFNNNCNIPHCCSNSNNFKPNNSQNYFSNYENNFISNSETNNNFQSSENFNYNNFDLNSNKFYFLPLQNAESNGITASYRINTNDRDNNDKADQVGCKAAKAAPVQNPAETHSHSEQFFNAGDCLGVNNFYSSHGNFTNYLKNKLTDQSEKNILNINNFNINNNNHYYIPNDCRNGSLECNANYSHFFNTYNNNTHKCFAQPFIGLDCCTQANYPYTCSSSISLLNFSHMINCNKGFLEPKIFNVAEIIMCQNKINKLSTGFFDSYNILLIVQIYANDFKFFNIEKNLLRRYSAASSSENKEIRNLKSLSSESNELSVEETLKKEIHLKVKNFFTELNNIQNKYLTKASACISKKSIFNCSLIISEINSLIEKLIELNPHVYHIIGKEAQNKRSSSQAVENKIINKKNILKKKDSEAKDNNNYSKGLELNDSVLQIDLNLNSKSTNKPNTPFSCCLSESANIKKVLNKKKTRRNLNNKRENTDEIALGTNIGSINHNNNFNYYNSNSYNFLPNLSLNNDCNNKNNTNDKPKTCLNSNNNSNNKCKDNQDELLSDKKNIFFPIHSAALANDFEKLQRVSASLSSSEKSLNHVDNIDNNNNTSKSLKISLKAKITQKSKANNDKNTNRQISDLSSDNGSSSLSATNPADASNEEKEVYKCEHCEAFYESGQALGGHMSRKHPNLSVKYKKKKMVRDRRESQRNVLYEAKKELLSNYEMDYEDMRNDKVKKQVLKNFIRKHSGEYKSIVKKLKKQNTETITPNKAENICKQNKD